MTGKPKIIKIDERSVWELVAKIEEAQNLLLPILQDTIRLKGNPHSYHKEVGKVHKLFEYLRGIKAWVHFEATKYHDVEGTGINGEANS